jgi:hypothetical protein
VIVVLCHSDKLARKTLGLETTVLY